MENTGEMECNGGTTRAVSPAAGLQSSGSVRIAGGTCLVMMQLNDTIQKLVRAAAVAKDQFNAERRELERENMELRHQLDQKAKFLLELEAAFRRMNGSCAGIVNDCQGRCDHVSDPMALLNDMGFVTKVNDLEYDVRRVVANVQAITDNCTVFGSRLDHLTQIVRENTKAIGSTDTRKTPELVNDDKVVMRATRNTLLSYKGFSMDTQGNNEDGRVRGKASGTATDIVGEDDNAMDEFVAMEARDADFNGGERESGIIESGKRDSIMMS